MAILNYGRVDIRALSYSRSSMLHQCPRKYLLEQHYKMSSNEPSNTFAYGHMVGRAIQETAAGHSKDVVIFRAMCEWGMDIYELGSDNEQRALKSFWWGMELAEKFWELEHDPRTAILDGWEVAMLRTSDGKLHSGIELEFSIDCGPDSDWENASDYDPNLPRPHFVYEGHIDCLLINKEHTKFRVLEIKTSSANNLHEAQYQNSMQGAGYSVMVDKAAEVYGINPSYEVLYLVVLTKTQEFKPLPFIKSPVHRAEFLLNLGTDIEIIQMYNRNDHWPTNGGACYDFFRACKHLNLCTMSRETIAKAAFGVEGKPNLSFKTDENFAPFRFTLEELLVRQEAQAIHFVGE